VPSKEEHIAKANGDAAFALSLSLDSQPQIDWALVALFYAALHYVEAYLAVIFGMHTRSHTRRDSIVGRDSNLRRIFHEYQDLKFFGYNARYEMGVFRPKDVTDQAVPKFEKIKSHLKKFL